MPNWCQNSMLVTGAKIDVEKFINKVKSSESDFDFNGILPMPESLSVEASSIAEKAYKVYYGTQQQKYEALRVNNEQDFQTELKEFEKNAQAKQLADTYHHNVTHYGFTTWYEWSIEVWGTKWNACEPNKGEVVKVAGQELYQIDYQFETAWSYPKGVYEEIAKQFPQLVVSIDVDEEGGYFWGNILLKDGQLIEDLQEGTRPGGPYDYGDEDEE